MHFLHRNANLRLWLAAVNCETLLKTDQKYIAWLIVAALSIALGATGFFWFVGHMAMAAEARSQLILYILGASLLALLSIFSLAYLIYAKTQQRQKNALHLETLRLLERQEALNSQLLLASCTIRDNEEKLSVTLKSIGDAVIATDADARVTLLNPVAEALCGWRQAEACGRPVNEIFHIINKATRRHASIPIMDALAHGTTHGLANHTVLISRDGTEYDIADSCAPIRNQDGLVVGAVLVFRNVTAEYVLQHELGMQQIELAQQNNELLLSRAALEASQARYFNLYDLAPVGYCTLSESGLIIETNSAAAVMLNIGRDALVKRAIADFIDREDTVSYYLIRQQLLVTGDPQACELRMRKCDGQQFWAHLSISAAHEGELPVLRIVMTDISARKAAEEALLKAGALQRAIFNSATFSSIATDASGVVQIFNVGAERMLGYSAEDVVDKLTPADISDPQELIVRAQALSKELSTPIAPGFEALVYKASHGIEDFYEQTYIRKNGSRFPAIVSVTALRDADETIIGFLLIGTDNSARKRVEAEREQLGQALKDKNVELERAKIVAEEANMAKSEFLSSMSHELRTPLGAILGFAQLIDTGTPPPTPNQKRNIDQILKAGWYLLELINEILDLAVIESGKFSLSIEVVSLAEVLHECEVMIGPQAQQRGISLAFAKIDGPSFVKADRTRVKQILINLLSNAIKYNRPGGTVAVMCVQRRPGKIRIKVQDTGAGLSAAQLAQLFEPFNRLGQNGSVEEGSGIGLVVCRRLVESMQGIIGVESTVGQGSVFWVEFELSDEPPALRQSADAINTALGRDKIEDSGKSHTLLYVEDNPANLMLVEEILARRDDIRMLSAKDGLSGVELAQATLPNVILMDINLPGINGFTALSLLTEDIRTAHIPVIALSANAMPRDIERGLAAGFFGYLTKPIKIGQFMHTLDDALKIVNGDAVGITKEEES